MPSTVPPFAPEPPRFPCPALTAAAARAPLGGSREALLGALLVSRLASGLCPPHPLPTEVRQVRATGAKGWLTALAVPSKLRALLQRAIAASAQDAPAEMASALDAVTDVTAAHLDKAARSELDAVASALRAAAALLAAPVHPPVK